MWMIEVSFCSEKSAASYCIDNNLIFLTLIFWILSLQIELQIQPYTKIHASYDILCYFTHQGAALYALKKIEVTLACRNFKHLLFRYMIYNEAANTS